MLGGGRTEISGHARRREAAAMRKSRGENVAPSPSERGRRVKTRQGAARVGGLQVAGGSGGRRGAWRGARAGGGWHRPAGTGSALRARSKACAARFGERRK